MFKHILLPTDGSSLSVLVLQKGIQFAKAINARVTGFCVVPELHYLYTDSEIPEGIRESYTVEAQTLANKYLLALQVAATEAGVQCETVQVLGDQVYEEIIRAAEVRGCDLIIMASHGRRGVKGLLLGSETQKVLTHSKVPVLVYR